MKRRYRSTGPSSATRDLVIARDGGCVLCGSYEWMHIHHRKPRRLGGRRRHPEINDVTNLVVLCGSHHEWVESRRQEARELGLLLAESDDPAQVPVAHWWRGHVYLTARGWYEPAAHVQEAP